MIMVLKGMAAVLWLAVVPLFIGNLMQKWPGRQQPGIIWSIVLGYLAMFALLELIFVPLILLRAPFHTAVYLMAGVLLLLSLLSVIWCRRSVAADICKGFYGLLHQPAVLYLAAVLILLQALMYAVFMVTDLDDAYFVATAATSLECDTMYQHSPYTGELMATLETRYVLSPMPMFIAFIARCTGFSAAVTAHTVLPVFLVVLTYLVCYTIGDTFFPDNQREIGLFLVFLSLLHISSYYSAYTQGTFLLIRIWQGKAVLASILLPFLFCMCYRALSQQCREGDWQIIFLTVLSCCMVSSMGVALVPVMLGMFGLLFGVLRRKWKQVGLLLLNCTPCVVLGVLYLVLSKIQ